MTKTPEATLVREKARRMTNGQLADEIKRCHAGIQVATSPSAVTRYERRIHIMQAEADQRMAAAGGPR